MRESLESLVIFRLGDERYAVPLDLVRELGRVPRLTIVPRLPSFVAGVANLRGHVLGVVDLRVLLTSSAAGEGSRRMLVLQHDDITMGVIVDAVDGVVDLEGEMDPAVATLPDWLRPHVRGHVHDGVSSAAVLDPSLLAALQSRAETEAA
jgi:purine-binding chemotaxis protein CheW